MAGSGDSVELIADKNRSKTTNSKDDPLIAYFDGQNIYVLTSMFFWLRRFEEGTRFEKFNILGS